MFKVTFGCVLKCSHYKCGEKSEAKVCNYSFSDGIFSWSGATRLPSAYNDSVAGWQLKFLSTKAEVLMFILAVFKHSI